MRPVDLAGNIRQAGDVHGAYQGCGWLRLCRARRIHLGLSCDNRGSKGFLNLRDRDYRFGEDLRRPIGPIHWACTDIAGVGHIHMEGAVRSGRRAAEACLAAVPA